MITECIFPTELLYQILGYTSARDVFRWRTVSKQFCAITYEPEMWKALHANAPFMCPPELPLIGSVDRALVRSERLAQSWSQDMCPLRLLSRIEIPFSVPPFQHGTDLIGGRWLIMCTVLCEELVLYDTHPNAEARVVPTVLWEERDNKIKAWYNNRLMCREGRWVAYVLLFTGNPTRSTLLELSWGADSGSSCNSVDLGDIPGDMSIGTEDIIVQPSFDSSRFIYMLLSVPSLVFDTITRTFYEFPTFRIALDQTMTRIGAATHGPHTTLEVTDTHVIVLHHYPSTPTSGLVVVQAFTVPDNQHPAANGNGILHLSHEGSFESQDACFDVIRNSVVDFATGSVNVRLLGRGYRWRHETLPSDMYCVDLTLHSSSVVDVLPMTIKLQSIVQKGDDPSVDARIVEDEYWDISDQGYARGLWIGNYDEPLTCQVAKLSIDATGDRCVAVFGRKVKVGQIGDSVEYTRRFINDVLRVGCGFDGARGKLNYSYPANDLRSRNIVVVDIE